MSILSFFGRREEKGLDYATSGGYEVIQNYIDQLRSGVLGDFGKIGDPYSNITAVFACTNRIATNLAGLKKKIYKTGSTEPLTDGALYRLFDHPLPDTDKYKYWEAFFSYYIITGGVYSFSDQFSVRDGMRLPIAMVPYPQTIVSTEKDNNGRIIQYYVGQGAKKKSYAPDTALTAQTFNPNGGNGIPAFQAARTDIMLSFYAYQYNINFFKQGGQVPGFLRKRDSRKPLSRDKERELQEAWSSRGEGVQNQHKVPVFNDLEYVPVGSTQRDMDFLSTIEKADDKIFMAMGVPKSLFGFTDTTFNNMAEAKKYFWNETLIPIIRRAESVFQAQFFDRYGLPYRLEFGVDEVKALQEDINTQADTALKFYQMGVPFNMINARLGLGFDPVPGGDDPAYGPPVETEEPQEDQQDEKAIIKTYEIKKAISREKRLMIDEVMRRKEADRSVQAMLSIERPFKKALEGAFIEMYKDIEKYIDEDKEKGEFTNRLLAFIQSFDWHSKILKISSGYIERGHKLGAQRTFRGVGARFNIPPLRALTYYAQREIKIKQSVDTVRQVIEEGLKKGGTVEEIKKMISKAMDTAEKKQARAIAQTETTGAYNGGRIDGMKELGITRKQWLHSHDSKVRDSHRINQIVNVDESFVLASGNRIDFPGGSCSDPGDVVNCRCSVLSVLSTDDEERILESNI